MNRKRRINLVVPLLSRTILNERIGAGVSFENTNIYSMKKSTYLTAALCALLLFGFLGLQSCAKKKARQNIEGVWTFVSSTVNGEENPITYSGTYEFKECSGSDNRKGNCEMIQDLTLEYQGTTETVNNTLPYKIYKGQKGLELLLDDSAFRLSLSETELTLTSFESEEIVVINFVKQ